MGTCFLCHVLSFPNVDKMVVSTALSPDPSTRPDGSFLPADVGMIVPSSSDSEGEEDISHEGYEVLPQELCETNSIGDDDGVNEEDSSDDRNDINLNLNNLRESPSFDRSTELEVSELWNSVSSNRETDILIDSAKIQQIKNAMAGFKLPPTAIPSWASEIPEEEWQEQLRNRVAMLSKFESLTQQQMLEFVRCGWK